MKLIDKDALVAEIKKRGYYTQTMSDNAINGSMRQFYDGMKQGCIDILSTLNTLEVKEVDLEKEYKEFIQCTDGRSMFETAKHFFELGINLAQKGEEL